MWQELLKHANVSIHVIATGGGAGFLQKLWAVPGSSSYLSGFSFPYATEEQTELLGFIPEHYCSKEAAVDLASAAYMKSYRFGGKSPVGIALTATVASEKEHRGDNRIHCCIMTDHLIRTYQYTLVKGIGERFRLLHGISCDNIMFNLLSDALALNYVTTCMSAEDATQLAMDRFFLRPFFHADGTRDNSNLLGNQGLMSGAFNPPHEGHFGMAKSFKMQTGWDAVLEVSTDPPHKDALTVQDMLKRAKLLQGHERIFTKGCAKYIDKSVRYPGHPFILGADAALRLFDPKWGIDPDKMLDIFERYETKLYVTERVVDCKLVTDVNITEIIQSIDDRHDLIRPLKGHWDISSTELRNKVHQ